MTSATNPTAAGGKIWNPSHTISQLKRMLLDVQNLQAIIVTVTIIAVPVALGFLLNNQLVKVIATTPSTIQLEYNVFNRGQAEEHIKPWVPTALGLEATANTVILSNLHDGATGSVILTNGDSVPFTLHNYDNTFTVTEE